jgi:hypothetical protein
MVVVELCDMCVDRMKVYIDILGYAAYQTQNIVAAP